MRIGLVGTAEPAWPYDEEGNIIDPSLGKVSSDEAHFEAPVPTYSETASSQGLSLVTKLVLFAILVGVCFAYVKSHSPRSTQRAGRHGAYEKGGLA